MTTPSESSPKPEIKATYLELSETHLASSYPFPTFIVILDNVFTPSECAAFISRAVASSPDGAWSEAGVYNGYQTSQVVYKEARDCGRIILDDQELADMWLERIRPWLKDVEVLGGPNAVKELTDFSVLTEAEKDKVLEKNKKRGGKDEDWVGIIGNRGLRGQQWKMTR